MQRNTLNRMFKTLRHQKQMILSSSRYEKTHLQDVFERLLKSIQVSSLYQYPHDFQMVGSLLQRSSPREKEKKRENSHKACMGTLSCGHPPHIYRHLVYRFFIKTVIIMFLSTNIYRPYVCDPLVPYISLVNNSIDQITPYFSTLIN